MTVSPIAIHEDLTRTVAPEGLSDRATGIWLGILFVLGSVWPLMTHRPLKLWALIIAMLTLLSSIAVPRILRPVNWLLTCLGLLMSKLTNPIVMALLFYLVFTPMGAVIRLLGKDLLGLRPDPNVDTYWKRRTPPGPSAATMSNPF